MGSAASGSGPDPRPGEQKTPERAHATRPPRAEGAKTRLPAKGSQYGHRAMTPTRNGRGATRGGRCKQPVCVCVYVCVSV